MCGFTGFYSPNLDPKVGLNVLQNMNDKLIKRGPDGEGQWHQSEDHIYLAHRRLAIVDLSDAGKQPMQSKDLRYVIDFNGEIYNHMEIRKELQFSDDYWQGHSDTETLVCAIQQWGLEATLSKIKGMFAFAIWDKQEKTLSLARDRFGEKPLYYGWQKQSLIFGSDLSALEVHPDFENVIDRDALVLLLRHNSIPAPRSIFQGVQKLLPGAYITFSQLDLLNNVLPDVTQYWEPSDSMRAGLAHLSTSSEKQDLANLKLHLGNAVELQLMSDVPLGAFLSGGIDSTAVVTQMVERGNTKPKTFTIGSENSQEDESVVAQSISKILGTDHTSLIISPEQALGVVSELPQIYSEPFGDSSQIPTYLVSKLASDSVKVALSGDGGDELFGGYNRYHSGLESWKRLNNLPAIPKSALKKISSLVTPNDLNYLANLVNPLLPKSKKQLGLGDKMVKLNRVMEVTTPEDYYATVISDNLKAESFVIGATKGLTGQNFTEATLEIADMQNWMMIQDAMGYLPTDVLTKVDRAAMAASLETRAPFLDIDLYNFSWTLSPERKIHNGSGKYLLKKLVYSYLPSELMNRPKQGFGIPIATWLRGALRDWAEDLLDATKLEQEGFLDSHQVQALWKAHLSNKVNVQHQLWSILMFQQWLRSKDKRPI